MASHQVCHGDWLCLSCGDVNTAVSVVCSCTAHRPTPRSLVIPSKRSPSHWDCPTCGNVVFPVRKVCPLCWCLKPGTLTVEIDYIRRSSMFAPTKDMKALEIRVGPPKPKPTGKPAPARTASQPVSTTPSALQPQYAKPLATMPTFVQHVVTPPGCIHAFGDVTPPGYVTPPTPPQPAPATVPLTQEVLQRTRRPTQRRESESSRTPHRRGSGSSEGSRGSSHNSLTSSRSFHSVSSGYEVAATPSTYCPPVVSSSAASDEEDHEHLVEDLCRMLTSAPLPKPSGKPA